MNGEKAKTTKWDTKKKRISKRINDANKVSIYDTYQNEMLKGKKTRDEILKALQNKYFKSTRQIERYIAEVQKNRESTSPEALRRFANLIERWRAEVRTNQFRVTTLDSGKYDVFYPVEKEQLFSKLRDSHTGELAWLYLNDFKKVFIEIFELVQKAVNELRVEASNKTGVKFAPKNEEEGLTNEFITSLLYHRGARQTVPLFRMLLLEKTFGLDYALLFGTGDCIVTKTETQGWELRLGKACLARVPTKNLVERIIDIYKEMVANLLNHRYFKEFLEGCLLLQEVQQKLEKELERLMFTIQVVS